MIAGASARILCFSGRPDLDPVLPGQLEGGLDGLRAARERIDQIEVARATGAAISAASSSTGSLVNAVPFT